MDEMKKLLIICLNEFGTIDHIRRITYKDYSEEELKDEIAKAMKETSRDCFVVEGWFAERRKDT